jgi:hypothetical protein
MSETLVACKARSNPNSKGAEQCPKRGRRRHSEGFNALAIIFMLAVAAGIA